MGHSTRGRTMTRGRPPKEVTRTLEGSAISWKGRIPCAIFTLHLLGEAKVDGVNLFSLCIPAILGVGSFFCQQIGLGVKVWISLLDRNGANVFRVLPCTTPRIAECATSVDATTDEMVWSWLLRGMPGRAGCNQIRL